MLPSYDAHTPTAPSPDPKMWAGSYLAQMEARNEAISKQCDDVDMEAAVYVASHPDYEQFEPPSSSSAHKGIQRYLTLDTNVLINHLPLIQSVFKAFSALNQDPISLLIPTVVINELDNPSGTYTAETLFRSRQATSWLLAVNRHRRETGYGAVRCQRWSERGEASLRKADDRVLDCALYFRKVEGGAVMLWTEDRNLSLLAEAEDISTITSSPTSGLTEILRQCGILNCDPGDPYDPEALPVFTAPNGDMQIEADILDASPQPPRQPHRSPKPPSNRHTPTREHSPFNQPCPSQPPNTNKSKTMFKDFTPLPSRIAVSRMIVPSDILARLSHFADLILRPFPASPLPSRPSTPTSISVRRVYDHLDFVLEGVPTRSAHSEQNLYRLRGSLKTLADWVRPRAGHQPVLTMEAARALEDALKVWVGEEMMPEEGLQEWGDLVKSIKAL